MFGKVLNTFGDVANKAAVFTGFKETPAQEMYNAIVCVAQSGDLKPQGLARAMIGFEWLFDLELNPHTIFDNDGEKVLRSNHMRLLEGWLEDMRDDKEHLKNMMDVFLANYNELPKSERATRIKHNAQCNANYARRMNLSPLERKPFYTPEEFEQLEKLQEKSGRQ